MNSEKPLRLTKREQEVAKQLAQGHSNKQIAQHLGLSPHTIRDILSSIYRKLNTSNRIDAAIAISQLAALESDSTF